MQNTNRYWLVILILAVISCILVNWFSLWAYDDPFISYRYAENLITGAGFVYNPGERILSTTTPFFTIILALAGLFSSQLHLIANGIGILSLVVGAIFIFDLARTFETPLAGWSALLLFPTFPLLVSTLGSETPLYLAFCLGAFSFYARRNLLAAGIFGTLAALTRPDGILVIGIIAAHYFLSGDRKIPWKPILIGAVLLAAWIGFAWFYFGSPIPVTLAAKQRQGLMSISEPYYLGLLTVLKSYVSWPYILEALLAFGGLVFAVLQRRAWLLILSWPVIYFLSYSLLGVSRYFWYYAPLVPGFIIAVGLGLSALNKIIKGVMTEKRRFEFLPLLISATLLTVLFFVNGVNLWQMGQNNDPRYEVYKAAGEWINENTMPDDKIGALEVGIIGFFAKRPMVDFAGLIQPEVAKQFRADTNYEDAAVWAIKQYQPDYLVLPGGVFSNIEQQYVQKKCAEIERLPADRYPYNFDLIIYDCR